MWHDLLDRLGLCIGDGRAGLRGSALAPGGEEVSSINPATGELLARVPTDGAEGYERCVTTAVESFRRWRALPPPVRGGLVRKIGEALRTLKPDLGMLITLETGKLRSEGEGEVQEMIDMCDFAVGLSRQLHGLTIASERPEHRMMEQWHPLGPIGIITAFNFPAAVWAWNAMVAAVCGDSMVWKPSPLTPLTALAVQGVVERISGEAGFSGLFGLCIGGAETIGERMIADSRFPLISATGSCRMGRRVAEVVGRRLGRCLLELGGNNAIIVAPDADLELAIRAVVFAAVGTTGQRCTTARRLIVHRSLFETLLRRLKAIFTNLRIGEPWEDGVHVGPLIRPEAVERMTAALDAAREQGGEVVWGGKRLDRPGFFIEPALVRAVPGMPIMAEETFAPILYVLPYSDIDEAIAVQNSVEQGLSSAIFTRDLLAAERFLSVEGSDCGIANVNIGTSGAEIGGAFGGEKSTGGGREAGSDSWKAYMRRQTCTINYGTSLPLAQNVVFEIAP